MDTKGSTESKNSTPTFIATHNIHALGTQARPDRPIVVIRMLSFVKCKKYYTIL